MDNDLKLDQNNLIIFSVIQSHTFLIFFPFSCCDYRAQKFQAAPKLQITKLFLDKCTAKHQGLCEQ